MNILGISCYYHDSAACLIKDGQLIAAAQEERFNREKNSQAFPGNAIHYCLQQGDISIYDVDYVGFHEKPFLKFSRVVKEHVRSYPFSFRNFISTMPSWLDEQLIIPLVLKKKIGFNGTVLFVKHHLSHGASSFLVSPFDEAAIISADGIGEWATMVYGYGKANKVKIMKELHYPHSLGLLYSAVTTYLGFRSLRGEGKVMGLAGYGRPSYLDTFKKIVAVKPDGSFRLDRRYFGFNKGSRLYSRKFIRLFGRERRPEDEITERHCDIAATLQHFIEQTLVKVANNVYKDVKMKKLCLAGGVFLNCLANHKILEETPFEEVFIQPAAGDSGGALGAASYIYHVLLGNKRNYKMSHSYYGPEYSYNQIKRAVLNNNLSLRELNSSDLTHYVAKRISEDAIVGWFQGRMEFGPRALGNRSVLANPCNPRIKDILNEKVKHREPFRPYAPAVLEERMHEFFKLKNTSPFMLLAAEVKREKKNLIPGVTHVDGTARVQSVNKKQNFLFWELIKSFEDITGIPMVLNTSFNLHGEPIVCSLHDAIECFKKTHMDLLVMGNFVVEK